MKKILKSASKIVFILVAVTCSVALFTGHINGEQYLVLAGMAFAFYFSHKGDKNEEYLGK